MGNRSARRAHQAVAEALHVKLTHMALPVRAFGLLLADQRGDIPSLRTLARREKQ